MTTLMQYIGSGPPVWSCVCNFDQGRSLEDPFIPRLHEIVGVQMSAFHASLPQGNSLLTMDQYGQLTEAIWNLVRPLMGELNSPQRCCSRRSIVREIHACWERYVDVLFRQVDVREPEYVVRCLTSIAHSHYFLASLVKPFGITIAHTHMRQAELEYGWVYTYACHHLQESSHDRLVSSRNYAVFMRDELGRTWETYQTLYNDVGLAISASCRQTATDFFALNMEIELSQEALNGWFSPYVHRQL